MSDRDKAFAVLARELLDHYPCPPIDPKCKCFECWLGRNTEMVRKSLERTAIGGKGLEQRLLKIIEECENETSGAEEDKHRDTVLANIIAIAKGEHNPAPTGSETT